MISNKTILDSGKKPVPAAEAGQDDRPNDQKLFLYPDSPIINDTKKVSAFR